MGSSSKRLQYGYDVRGNRRLLVDPDGGRFTYSYDSVGRMAQVLNPQGQPTTFSYSDAGRRTLKKLANGTRTSFSYDPPGNLTKLYNLKTDGTVLSSFQYAYLCSCQPVRVVVFRVFRRGRLPEAHGGARSRGRRGGAQRRSHHLEAPPLRCAAGARSRNQPGAETAPLGDRPPRPLRQRRPRAAS
jgi:YD repeat-containing protein